jgi:hypothetical protein
LSYSVSISQVHAFRRDTTTSHDLRHATTITCQ